MEEDWDYLVILDGCRYDLFSEVHGAFLEGDLEKVLSVGSNTVEWRDNSFPGRYEDVIYVSANPYINSRVGVKGFSARDHFHGVVDVWDWGWIREHGTVHPRTVNEAVHATMKNNPEKRLIIHYLQPHCPYLGQQPIDSGYPLQEPGQRTVLDGTTAEDEPGHIRIKILDLITAAGKSPLGRLLGLGREGTLWVMRELLGLPPASPMDAVRRARGVGGLREAYARNLELVLSHIAELMKDLHGEVVITADHGELLGEGGRFSHGFGRDDPLLLEVPWFEVRS